MTEGTFQTLEIDASAEVLYDVAADRWTEAAPMPRPRTQHSAVTLADGRVLGAGGVDTDGRAPSTTFVYDPAADVWSDGPPMVQARVQHVAVRLAGGDVLFAGGDGAGSGTSERYVHTAGQFVRSGTLVAPRIGAQAAALPDGRVVVSGGLTPRIQTFKPLRSAEIWDPVSEEWSDLPDGPTPRALAALVNVGRSIYQLSGTGDEEIAYRTVERLTFE